MASRVRFGAFEFDQGLRLLRRDGRLVRLSPKAADVLAVLLEAEGGLVAKEELLRRAWPRVRVDEGSLKVRIAELRRALGDDAAAPAFIETHLRRGYRFVARMEVEADGLLGAEGAERPSLGVLPFESGPSRVECSLAAALGRGLVRELARWREIRVVPLEQDAGRAAVPELLLEGSVRREARAVGFEVRLVDGTTRHPLFVGRFSAAGAGGGNVRARLVREAAAEIRRSFHPRASRRPSSEVREAWRHVLRARAHRWRGGRADNRRAQNHYRKALALDPEAAQVHADLVSAQSVELLCGWAPDLAALLAEGRWHARRALALDPASRSTRIAAAWDACAHRESQRALRHLETARGLGARRPPPVFDWLEALALLQLGRVREADRVAARLAGRALGHREGDLIFFLQASVALHRGGFEEAATAAECASAIRPAWTFDLTAAVGWRLAGRRDRAVQALQRVRRRRPGLSGARALANLGWMGPPEGSARMRHWLGELGLEG